MERIIKILIIIGLFFLGAFVAARAEDLTVQQLTTPTNVAFNDCFKTYNLPADYLYFQTLNSIAANRFEIKELQSKSGYIIFKAAGREFLAAVAYYGPNKSILKITPVNNSYYFAPGIVLNIFKYIDINLNEQIKDIPKS